MAKVGNTSKAGPWFKVGDMITVPFGSTVWDGTVTDVRRYGGGRRVTVHLTLSDESAEPMVLDFDENELKVLNDH